MIPPGALVMLSPIVIGTLFGTQALAGMLTGSLVSGVQLAISMSNTGGAWDNAKKYIEVRGGGGGGKEVSGKREGEGRGGKGDGEEAGVWGVQGIGHWNTAKKGMEAEGGNYGLAGMFLPLKSRYPAPADAQTSANRPRLGGGGQAIAA